MTTSLSGSSNGRGFRRTASITVNNMALAPMPSASVSTATRVNPGFLINWRRANLRSFIPLVIRGEWRPGADAGRARIYRAVPISGYSPPATHPGSPWHRACHCPRWPDEIRNHWRLKRLGTGGVPGCLISVFARGIGASRGWDDWTFVRGFLRFDQTAESPAVGPKEKQGNRAHPHSHGQSGGMKEDVKQENGHNHGAQQRQAQGHKASEQADRSPSNLQPRHDPEIVAHKERLAEIAGQALRRWHGHELQERVQAEHDKDEAQQTPSDDGEDLHFFSFLFGLLFLNRGKRR